MMFVELRKYVVARFGRGMWDALEKQAGVGAKFYLSVDVYSDDEAAALVAAASRMTGTPSPVILADFGEFIAPDLIRMYPHLIKPEWKALDLIEHTESTIHQLVRNNEKGADPPALRCTRVSPEEVALIYSSPRRLCSLAIGIAKGIAKHYGEQIEIIQTSCMLDGSPACNISIRTPTDD